MPQTAKLAWNDTHRSNARFLESVEASLCARGMREQFWTALPWLLSERAMNGMFSVREAVDAIENDHFDA